MNVTMEQLKVTPADQLSLYINQLIAKNVHLPLLRK
jgi:hypothetical protein